jgi:hypothetical protein
MVVDLLAAGLRMCGATFALLAGIWLEGPASKGHGCKRCQKLSIRNLDVLDCRRVMQISNFRWPEKTLLEPDSNESANLYRLERAAGLCFV